MTEDLTTPATPLEEPGIVREVDDGELPSVAVVETVGALTDRNPSTMDPLYDSIDPEVLDDLFGDRPSETATVWFRYLDCDVAVTDGFVYVTLDDDYSN